MKLPNFPEVFPVEIGLDENGQMKELSIMTEGLVCDACQHYPLTPVGAHFVCSECKYITKCCEGGVC